MEAITAQAPGIYAFFGLIGSTEKCPCHWLTHGEGGGGSQAWVRRETGETDKRKQVVRKWMLEEYAKANGLEALYCESAWTSCRPSLSAVHCKTGSRRERACSRHHCPPLAGHPTPCLQSHLAKGEVRRNKMTTSKPLLLAIKTPVTIITPGSLCVCIHAIVHMFGDWSSLPSCLRQGLSLSSVSARLPGSGTSGDSLVSCLPSCCKHTRIVEMGYCFQPSVGSGGRNSDSRFYSKCFAF